jgi:hypothetical protein
MNASYLKLVMPKQPYQRKISHEFQIKKLELLVNNPDVEIDIVAGTIKHPDIKMTRTTDGKHQSFKFGKFYYQTHDVIWYKAYGFIDFDYFIDHIDTNTDNNSITNLRLLTGIQNAHNMPRNINFVNKVNDVYEVGHMLLGEPHVKTFKTKKDAWAANARLNNSVRRHLARSAEANLINAKAKASLYNQYATDSASISKGDQ